MDEVNHSEKLKREVEAQLEADAKRKAAICRTCPNVTIRSRSDWDQCNLCGCPIDRLVRKKNKICEAGKW